MKGSGAVARAQRIAGPLPEKSKDKMKRKSQKSTLTPQSVEQARVESERADNIARAAKRKARSAKSRFKAAKKALKLVEKAAKKARKEARRARKKFESMLARQPSAKKPTAARQEARVKNSRPARSVPLAAPLTTPALTAPLTASGTPGGTLGADVGQQARLRRDS